MTSKPAKVIPVLIAGAVIGVVCLLQALPRLLSEPGHPGKPRFDLIDRVEWITYDWRMREASRRAPTVAHNLGFVACSDASIEALLNHLLGPAYGLLWPRHVYGRLTRELTAQGAKAIAFDILFAEKRPDHAPVVEPGQPPVESDDFFAREISRAGNVILMAAGDLMPTDLFRTNAWAVGDTVPERDSDGVVRRAFAFRDIRSWHPLLRQAAGELGLDLARSEIRTNHLILKQIDGAKVNEIPLPLNARGEFAVSDVAVPPPGTPPRALPFHDYRVWQMGIVLAARELNLDLAHAQVDLARGRIVLTGPGVERVIPVNRAGQFYVDWSLTPENPDLTKQDIVLLLDGDLKRPNAPAGSLTNLWRDKLVVIGSTATGSNLSDLGATPLAKHTLLFSEYWNVANSVIQGRFVRRASDAQEMLLIVLLGVASSILTWRLRVLRASFWVLALLVGYVLGGVWLFVRTRYWLPLVLPVGGALLMTHVCMVTWRVVVEQAERRRVKAIFSKIVSPDVVNELLGQEQLSLGGARRCLTVLFADVRGFTQMTDDNQKKAEEFVRKNDLRGAAADAHYEESARETLATVNLYLATIADNVKKHAGTLDKYIGDCVMAFWGAPTPNTQHALACVRAAIDSQRGMYLLNQQRFEENKLIEQENATRASAGQPPKALKALLTLGTGINTGTVTVGLMGSDAHILNYTVFGREVNLASRLEGVSGRGRIIVSETTYAELQRDDPGLAATCIAQAPVTVKGISQPVRTYEVPWKLAAAAPTGPTPSTLPVTGPAPSTPSAPSPSGVAPGPSGGGA